MHKNLIRILKLLSRGRNSREIILYDSDVTDGEIQADLWLGLCNKVRVVEDE